MCYGGLLIVEQGKTRKDRILSVVRRVKAQEPEIQEAVRVRVRQAIREQHEAEWDRIRASQPRLVELGPTFGAPPLREGMPEAIFRDIHHGPQLVFWPDPPCGHSIFRPDSADMFGPDLVALDAVDAILAGLMAEMAPPGLDEAEQARQDEIAVDGVRAWAMLNLYTGLHRDRPTCPDTLSRVMEHIREAVQLRWSALGRHNAPTANAEVATRLQAARAALADGYPGIEQHRFVVVLD